MVDVVSIVVAALSLLGTIITTAIVGFITIHRDRAHQQRETAKILAKYRDPLLLAALDLQSRLRNIIEDDFLATYYHDENLHESVVLFTAYLVGQYFAW